ncbi:hypothetical protein [Inquilinus limosus]|uniref:Uncharacterized protein n=1 Tax=Inquilinus limosus MP06 TaxID=1398085 RepID=A0A0A0DDC1_9PROT|nr:hypothetical protein [Inquilinus limosus]KGM36129.1 hypothetical protein P409_00340 [Inquilinus limosus MP06]
MSFALLNRLVAIVGEINGVSSAEMDPVVRDVILKEVLVKRGKSGLVEDENFDLDNYDMSIDDGIAILDWVSDHCLDFFIRQIEKAKATAEAIAPRLKSLSPSETGSQA